MESNNMEDTLIIDKFNNKLQTKSMNGTYYKKKNNSVIVVKENKRAISMFDYNSQNFFKMNNNLLSQLVRIPQNITIENLKDLLDIKVNKEEIYEEEISKCCDNKSTNLNPFKSYLLRTSYDNKRNMLKDYNLNKLYKYEPKKGQRNSMLEDQSKNEINKSQIENFKYLGITNSIAKDKNKLDFICKKKISSVIECKTADKEWESQLLNNQNNRYYEANSNEESLTRKIITNARMKDNIKWEKLKINKDDEDLLNNDMLGSKLVEGKNEIFKLYFKNSINYLDSRFKLKTPNDLKSKIGKQIKLEETKNFTSAKPRVVNNIYINSYIKDNTNLQLLHETKNFSNMNSKETELLVSKKFKKDDNLIKSKVRQVKHTNIENIFSNENIEENIKILKKKVNSPINNNIIVYNNIVYNQKDQNKNKNVQKFKNSLKLNNQENISEFQQRLNSNFKVKLDNINKENEIKRNLLFNDNCNTSNGFNNLVEYNSHERDNINNQINSEKESAFQNINNFNIDLEVLVNNKSSNKTSLNKKVFLNKVDWKGNKSVKIIKRDKFYSNNNYDSINSYPRENIDRDFKKRISTNLCIPSIASSQYYKNDTSKYKFKVLKKNLTKESQRVFNLLDNLKKAQSDLMDSKRRFLIHSTENKLKRHTRSCQRIPI